MNPEAASNPEYDAEDDITVDDLELDLSGAPGASGEPTAVFGVYADVTNFEGQEEVIYFIDKYDPRRQDYLNRLNVLDLLELIADEHEAANYHQFTEAWARVFDVVCQVADERVADEVIREAIRSGRYWLEN